MKKCILFLLTLALLWSLAGCFAGSPEHTEPPQTTVSVTEEPTVQADRIPMVMVDGKLYLDTGRKSTVIARCGVRDGEITSTVESWEIPAADDQSNFGTGYGYQYGTEGTIEIYMNEAWWVFALEDVQEDTIRFHDKAFSKADLSQSTIEWLTWYNTLSEEEQLAISYIPSDLYELCGYSTTEDAAPEETQSSADHYQAYHWMVNLKAEEVAYVEFLNFSDPQFPYRRYEGTEIQEIIDLFQAKKCLEYMPFHPVYEYEPVVQWQGYFTREFHVVMKDGTTHTVCSVYSVSTVIDGTGYHTISDWLNHHWPESGNAPLPENWEQEVASRKYHTAEVTSTLSTTVHDIQRENLNHSYDTDIAFGSRSRHYPIGRGGIELSASGASQTGVTISTYWTGTNGLTQLCVQPQYWLEKWQDDAETYLSLEDGQFSSGSPQELTPDNTRHWYVSWKDSLEPGHYRVGMTFCEKYTGSIRNETICYAKFSITE